MWSAEVKFLYYGPSPFKSLTEVWCGVYHQAVDCALVTGETLFHMLRRGMGG